MCIGEGGDFFGDVFKGCEVFVWILVAEGVVGDDFQALLEEGLEFGVHDGFFRGWG